MESRDFGIALSGGGHRATVFSLGALLAVADTGLHRRTASISSVSGGSIANGIVLAAVDFGTASPDEIEARIATATRAIADRGILQGGAPATSGYLRMLKVAGALTAVGLIAAIVLGFARQRIGLAVSLAVFVLGGWSVARLLAQRSVRTEAAIDRELLGNRKIQLDQLGERHVHHVICTTELQAGNSFFFSNRLSYGYDFGMTTSPAPLSVATAVQASACVPGAFQARRIPLTQLGLARITATVPAKRTKDGSQPPSATVTVDHIVVDDGGTYDNMADEWEYGFANRSRNFPQLAKAQPTPARSLLVVNGSGGWNRVKPIRSRGLRFELDGLLRAKDVQYDVSTSHRRRALGSLFREADGDPADVDGVFAQITSSPYDTATKFLPRPGDQPDAMAKRAQEAVDFLDKYGRSRDDWAELARRTSGVATTLKPLGAAVCQELLELAYMLTMINTHVVLGLGALLPTDRGRWQRLCTLGSQP